jgi:hypothetical protein
MFSPLFLISGALPFLANKNRSGQRLLALWLRMLRFSKVHPWSLQLFRNSENKKADVAEDPEVFDHVGLLANEPLGTAGLLSI